MPQLDIFMFSFNIIFVVSLLIIFYNLYQVLINKKLFLTFCASNNLFNFFLTKKSQKDIIKIINLQKKNSYIKHSLYLKNKILHNFNNFLWFLILKIKNNFLFFSVLEIIKSKIIKNYLYFFKKFIIILFIIIKK